MVLTPVTLHCHLITNQSENFRSWSHTLGLPCLTWSLRMPPWDPLGIWVFRALAVPDFLSAAWNKNCTFLHHNPVSWPYVGVGGPKCGSVAKSKPPASLPFLLISRLCFRLPMELALEIYARNSYSSLRSHPHMTIFSSLTDLQFCTLFCWLLASISLTNTLI